MYDRIEDLPPSIREALPEPAQEVYRAEYNRALQKLSAGEPEPSIASCVARAHASARLAVQRNFEQDSSGRWHPQPIGDYMHKPS